MKIGSLFSGIGGLELGLERSGIGRTVWQVEIDPFCRSILAKHWPHVTRYEDVRTTTKLPRVDLICGGFPCQDVSSAGNRAGLAGSRSGLWREFARVVSEVRPEWVVVENVASGAKLWVDAVVRDLGERGYAALPLPVSAAGVGAPHLRRRIFVVANTERLELRQQPGRRGGQGRAGTRELAHAREEGLAADPESSRLEIRCDTRAGRAPSGSPSWARLGSPGHRWGPPEPILRRVDDGFSGELDRLRSIGARRSANMLFKYGSTRTNRLRALGNAVVPQCAEVVGHVIRELMR